MTVIYGVDINIWVLIVAMVAVFIGVIMVVWVNKSVGLGFAFQLFKMKKGRNKGKMLLKIFVPNGRPQWKAVSVAPRIEYPYKENGKTKTGMVIFDYYSVYEMFNGIKVMECRTYDVLPRNPYIDTSLTISGEMVKKNAVDSAKEDFSNDGLKKFVKIALPLLIAFGVILILYSQGQTDNIAACYEQVSSLSRQLTEAKGATIVAN